MNIKLDLTIPAGPIAAKYKFFSQDENFTEYASIGTFGTAKSTALADWLILSALFYPGAQMALTRARLTDLKRTTLPKLMDRASGNGGEIAELNKTDFIIKFPEIEGKQSIIHCFGLDTSDPLKKLKSFEPFRIGIDEADEVTEDIIELCIMRLRQKIYHAESGKRGKLQLKIVANDEGNNWVWRRYVNVNGDKPHPGQMTQEWANQNVGVVQFKSASKRFRHGSIAELPDGSRQKVEAAFAQHLKLESGETVPISLATLIAERVAVYSLSDENHSLNEENLENEAFVSQRLSDKYFRGHQDLKTGLVYPEFAIKHHVLKSFDIPKDWKIIVAIDHGLNHPTAAAFVAINRFQQMVVFDEYEVANLSASENAYNILAKLEGGKSVRFVGDPAMWARNAIDINRSVASEYMEAGMKPFTQANNKREYGINRIKEMLVPRAAIMGGDERPSLFVMEHCKRYIERFTNFDWKDSEAKRNDDLMDALRYAVASTFAPKEMTYKEPPAMTWGFRRRKFANRVHSPGGVR